MTKFMSRAGAAGLFALCALSVSAPAMAGDDIVINMGSNGAITRSVAVPIADLQLGTASGRATLDDRIAMAARTACGHESVFGISQPRDYNRCYSQARSAARAQVGGQQTASR